MHTFLTVRTPLRVSFFGGGTDYPDYFSQHPAAVLGMAIDRYVYINALQRPAFDLHEFTISYSQLERVNAIADIQHPAVRVALQEFNHTHPIDISTLADIPARSGLGSSASFMVGLVNMLAALQDQPITRMQIAQTAIMLEQDKLQHTCGVQDQLHAAFGGLNYFDLTGGNIRVQPVRMDIARLRRFQDSMLLVFTGQTRSAPAVLEEQMQATRAGKITQDLQRLYEMAEEGLQILETGSATDYIGDFGALLHESWLRKRGFSSQTSNSAIDELYELGRRHGAYGGKLCGAGGGGFVLFVMPPEKRAAFVAALSGKRDVVDVGLDTQGTTVLAKTTVPVRPRHEAAAQNMADILAEVSAPPAEPRRKTGS